MTACVATSDALAHVRETDAAILEDRGVLRCPGRLGRSSSIPGPSPPDRGPRIRPHSGEHLPQPRVLFPVHPVLELAERGSRQRVQESQDRALLNEEPHLTHDHRLSRRRRLEHRSGTAIPRRRTDGEAARVSVAPSRAETPTPARGAPSPTHAFSDASCRTCTSCMRSPRNPTPRRLTCALKSTSRASVSGIGRGGPESGTSSPRARAQSHGHPPVAADRLEERRSALIRDDDAIAQRIHVPPNVVAERGKPPAQSVGVNAR